MTQLHHIAKLCAENGTIGTMTWMGLCSMINEKNRPNIKNNINLWVKTKKELKEAQDLYDQIKLNKRTERKAA